MNFDANTVPVAGLQGDANVLVTGASSGIGLAMVRQLLENRRVARVFAVSRSATRNDALPGLFQQTGAKLLLIDADITSESGLQHLA